MESSVTRAQSLKERCIRGEGRGKPDTTPRGGLPTPPFRQGSDPGTRANPNHQRWKGTRVPYAQLQEV
eukprot:12424861-Alexandrium_andersonii.AAC.1